MLVIDGLRESDLEVSVQCLAPQRNSVAEHGRSHQTDGLAVHHEPVLAGQWQVVPGADALHPAGDLRPAPDSRVTRQLLHCLGGGLGEPGDVEVVVSSAVLDCGHHPGTSGLLRALSPTESDSGRGPSL